MKLTITSLTLTLLCFCTLGFVASAQSSSSSDSGASQTEQNPQSRRGDYRRGGKRGGKDKMFRRGLSQLDLNDNQKQQISAIIDRYKTDSQTTRQEFRAFREQRRNGETLTPEQETRARELQQQFFQSQTNMKNEINAVLTAEQRAQLDKQRDEMREKRRERRNQRLSNDAPTQNTPQPN
ncbi:MAG: Spy/CpxP family protein refolding chaperone [Pyrinomonadaceae bacterium]|nr:Spy/CpxP family protein refolding chaperone [Pyrinomonadaceae bacterium]